jgi:hypothetical protein
MTTDKLCEVEGCKNKASQNYWSEFRGTWCDPCMTAQRIIDGEQKRRWAREDRRANRLQWAFSIVVAVLALWGLMALVKFFWMFS